MSNLEFILIDNHFKIECNDKGCYIISILPDDIEYLLFNSITTYERNPKVYQFILEIINLYQEGLAQIENKNLYFDYATLVSLTQEQKEKLLLPAEAVFSVKIEDKGVLGHNGFFFQYSLLNTMTEEEEFYQIQAEKKKKGSKYYTLSKYHYELFSIIKAINNLPQDENKNFEVWKSIHKLKELSDNIDITLSALFNRERIIIPSKMSFDIISDKYQNITLRPKLCGLTEDEQRLFLKQYDEFTNIQNNYLIVKTIGANTRIILPPEVKENIETIKNTPIIRRKKDKQVVLSNPYSIFKNPEVVSIEDFSSRVVDFGLYKKIATYKRLNRIAWAYPIYFDVINISEEKICIKVNNSNERKELEDILNDAYYSQMPYFVYNEEMIPFTEYNLFVLKDLLPKNIDEQEKITAKNSKDKFVSLTDINSIVHSINVTKELIEDLQQQMKNIRDSLKQTSLDYEPCLNIDDVWFPITTDNIKQIKAVVEIHLLENAENEIMLNLFDEILYNSYCSFVEDIPKELKEGITLKEHQKIGLAWLENSYKLKEVGRTGALLADDMGLGKTLQILSFIFWLKDKHPEFYKESKKPILIVAPVILLQNWKDEYYKFFDPKLGEPLILHSKTLRLLRTDGNSDFLGKEYYQITKDSSFPKTYLDIDEITKHNIVITNYETLSNYEYSLGKIDWSLVVLDEAQKIKNENSYQSQVACKLKSDFKIACTGTPIENSIMDIWNIFKFVQDDLLGPKRKFAEDFREDLMTEEKYITLQNMFFYKKPYAYILRRTKESELPDIPKKTIVNIDVMMSESFKNIYKLLQGEMRRGGGPSTLQKINLLHQYPKVLNNKIDIAENENCLKFEKLIELLNSIKEKNEKALIFCVYLDVQSILKQKLEEYYGLENIYIINGSSGSVEIRRKYIEHFSEAEGFNIMILSPMAAGTGLNIVAANHVIHYGRWWNPAIEKQATDRAYRIGQEKDVFVYYLNYKDKEQKIKSFDEYLSLMISNKIERSDNFLIPNNVDIEKAMINYMKEDKL